MRILRESLEITDPKLLKLPYGDAISVKINGKEYKYTPVEGDPLLTSKYKGDLGKVLNSIKYLLKIPAPRKVVDFLKNHFLVFEEITCAPTTHYFNDVIKPVCEDNIEKADEKVVEYLRKYIKASTSKSSYQIDKEINGFLDEYPDVTLEDLDEMKDTLWYWFGCDKENAIDYPDHHFLESVNPDENVLATYNGYSFIFDDGDYLVLNPEDDVVGSIEEDDVDTFMDFVDNYVKELSKKKEYEKLTPLQAWKFLTTHINLFVKALKLSSASQYAEAYSQIYKFFGFDGQTSKSDNNLQINIGKALIEFMRTNDLTLEELPEELAKSISSLF